MAPVPSAKDRDVAGPSHAAASESSRNTHSSHVKDTPLPWDQLSILCVVLLTESICSTVLIPFVPSFIAHIRGWAVESSGYASGFPVGLFMLGQVLSGKMWGTFSDKLGRKLSITVGVLGCAICMFFFGLSGSLWVMCFWRFMHGMSAGCSIVAKTMINDLTDTTNRAKGLALVSLTWGVGTLFGPAVGGYLYDPAHSTTLAFLHVSPTSFLGEHPAFLPSAVVAMYNLFAVVVSVVFLRESNKDAQPLRDVLPPSLVKILQPVLRFLQPRLPCDDKVAGEVTVTSADEHVGSGDHPTALKPSGAPATQTAAVSPAAAAPHKSFGFKQAFTDPLLRRVCVISMLISSSDMTFAQIFPLWLAADTSRGGLSLTPSLMANLVLVNSIPAVLANVVFAKVIELSGGPIRLWIVSQLLYGLSTAVMPIATSLGPTGSFWYTMVIGMLRKVVECWSFGLMMVLVSLTAPKGKVGIMFGIQQSTACMVRCVVPFIFAPLFAWSIANPHTFPFNHYLVFLLCVVPLVIGAYMATKVYVPTDDDAEEEADQSDPGATDDGERQSRLNSARGSVRSRYSFFGAVNSDHRERESLLRNSFADLANSFATNITPGVMQNTILAVPVGAPLALGDENGIGAPGPRRSESGDSRDNSSQEGDDVDEDDEYTSISNEMVDVTATFAENQQGREDVRIAQRSTLLEDEELPT
ncbi:transporter-like protein [Novymonas esmeraldas]|uniref:Transporter-like protein n=1 Tax=Novymonas esmeraldas TaxID=1808958 RepID=A0AAW0EQP0_9TRYP